MGNLNSDRAYNYIRKRILSGEFYPGYSLMTNVLSNETGVSRTPVREALRQLETDGLVSIRPRLGASVKMMDLKEFQQVCELRLALESFSAGLAAQHSTEAELDEIESALKTMGKLTDQFIADGGQGSQVLVDIAAEDVRFHLAIMSAAKNDVIKSEILRLHLINRVVSRPVAGGRDSSPSADTAQKIAHRRLIQAEHEEIFDAIRRRDTEAAKNSMERHIHSIIDSNLLTRARADRSLSQKALAKDDIKNIYNSA